MLEEYVAGTELNGIMVVRGGEPTLLTLSDRLRPPGTASAWGGSISIPRRSNRTWWTAPETLRSLPCEHSAFATALRSRS